MSTMLLERFPALDQRFEHDTRTGPLLAERAEAHGRLTLDDLITGVWEGLAVRGTVNCPVCENQMAVSARGSDESPTGICLDCGSRLY
jgi:hypothetical protein